MAVIAIDIQKDTLMPSTKKDKKKKKKAAKKRLFFFFWEKKFTNKRFSINFFAVHKMTFITNKQFSYFYFSFFVRLLNFNQNYIGFKKENASTNTGQYPLMMIMLVTANDINISVFYQRQITAIYL